MKGLGTVINALAIIAGGVLGILCKKYLKESYQDTITKATGCSVLFLGIAGTISKMLHVETDGSLSTNGSMIMILSLAIGALLGEVIDLDAKFERFGEWLKHKTGSDGDNLFVNGFVSASLTVSIGTMAVIGSIQDGIYGDHSTLIAKAIFYYYNDYGFVYGERLCIFISSCGCSPRSYDCFICRSFKLYDRNGTELYFIGWQYSDLLCWG